MHRPERPFIPLSTPTPRRAAAGAVSFHLPRPFIHGAGSTASQGVEWAAAESPPESDDFGLLAGAATEATASLLALPPIDDFLEVAYDLPPVEHFLDPLPLVDALAPDGEAVLMADAPETNGMGTALGDYQTETPEMFGLEETAWVETGWQQFDWSGAAALGEGAAEASDAWRETDWETRASPVRDFRETAAHAIANALDEIANRIRNGELAVPPPGGLTDPAAIAATLAALLGVRR